MSMVRILVVEDEEFLMRTLKDNLEAEGFEVDIALNADEALGFMNTHSPDLILLDIIMPRKDGFYVLDTVKKNPAWRTIPVIMLSNLGGDEDIERAMAMGADGYFIKSQHPLHEVIAAIRNYIKKAS